MSPLELIGKAVIVPVSLFSLLNYGWEQEADVELHPSVINLRPNKSWFVNGFAQLLSCVAAPLNAAL